MSLLGTTNWRGYSLLSIDPGLTCTGWAVFRMNEGVRLSACGKVRSEDFMETDESLPRRLAPILDAMCGVCNQHKPAVVVVEQPPQTIYKAKMLKKEMIIAKAQSVFKTFAVCAGLLAALRNLEKVQLVTTVLPVQWEYGKTKRGGLDVKAWSMKMANEIIDLSGNTVSWLRTQEDQNVADAITMGFLVATSI